MNTNTNSPMTIAEFFEAAKKLDWYYSYSDDARAYNAGQQNYEKLQKMANENPVFEAILVAFSKHMFSGPTFGTERSPEPKLEDFLPAPAPKYADADPEPVRPISSCDDNKMFCGDYYGDPSVRYLI